MKLEISKDGHRFYEPVFKQLAEIVDKDYKILYDSTGESLSLSFTVVSKKYKHHGLHISTHLGSNPEWKISSYYSLPLNLNQSFYEFTPEKDDEGFPLLTSKQIAAIKTKIKAIDKSTLREIDEYGTDVELGQIALNPKDLSMFVSTDTGPDLRVLTDYGINVDYSNYLLNPSRDMLNNYRLIKSIMKSPDPKVREYTEESILMYIDQITVLSIDNAIKAIGRFDREIFAVVTDTIKDEYIDMVDGMYSSQTEIDIELESWNINHFIHLFDDNYVRNKLSSLFYNKTKNSDFLSKEVQDVFLF